VIVQERSNSCGLCCVIVICNERVDITLYTARFILRFAFARLHHSNAMSTPPFSPSTPTVPTSFSLSIYPF
jgi:hypothetical protein